MLTSCSPNFYGRAKSNTNARASYLVRAFVFGEGGDFVSAAFSVVGFSNTGLPVLLISFTGLHAIYEAMEISGISALPTEAVWQEFKPISHGDK